MISQPYIIGERVKNKSSDTVYALVNKVFPQNSLSPHKVQAGRDGKTQRDTDR